MAETDENNVQEGPPAKRPAFSIITNDLLEEKKNIFYNVAADTQFSMSDGEIIKFNKAMLVSYANSQVFYQMLFGPLKEEITTISDINSSTFRLFLDCLMGFAPYNFDNAFTILPVAWKYQIEKCINDCFDAFTSNNLSDFDSQSKAICDVLNLIINETLSGKMFDLISDNYGLCKFFEDKRYCFLLEPNPLVGVLKKVNLDSYGINILLEWGQNYLTKYNMDVSIRELFDECGITNFIKFECFETSYSIFEFGFTALGWSLFTDKKTEMRDFLRGCVESNWRVIKKGEKMEEEIVADFSLGNNKSIIEELEVGITTNFCYFYGLEGAKCLEVKFGILGSTRQIRFLRSKKDEGFLHRFF